jgi:hypothetical protein
MQSATLVGSPRFIGILDVPISIIVVTTLGKRVYGESDRLPDLNTSDIGFGKAGGQFASYEVL